MDEWTKARVNDKFIRPKVHAIVTSLWWSLNSIVATHT